MFPSGPRPELLVGVILAAGASSRMGRPKALLDLDGAPLVARHVEGLARVCDRVRVVVGANEAAIAAAIPPMGAALRNPWWASTGPRESLLLALRDLPDTSWALVTPVDAPPAPAEVLGRLLATGQEAVPTADGKDGHPVLIDVGRVRDALLVGTLRDALRDAARVDVGWPDTALNFNTPEEWDAWRAARPPSPRRLGGAD